MRKQSNKKLTVKEEPLMIFYRTLYEHWKSLPKPKMTFVKFIHYYYLFEQLMKHYLETKFHIKFTTKTKGEESAK